MRRPRPCSPGGLLVCADEKTSIQAASASGDQRRARLSDPSRRPLSADGGLQLFCALVVASGLTLTDPDE